MHERHRNININISMMGGVCNMVICKTTGKNASCARESFCLLKTSKILTLQRTPGNNKQFCKISYCFCHLCFFHIYIRSFVICERTGKNASSARDALCLLKTSKILREGLKNDICQIGSDPPPPIFFGNLTKNFFLEI